MHPTRPSHAIVRIASRAALAGVLFAAWRHVSEVHSRRVGTRPRKLPENMQVWEGEGGQNQMQGQPPDT